MLTIIEEELRNLTSLKAAVEDILSRSGIKLPIPQMAKKDGCGGTCEGCKGCDGGKVSKYTVTSKVQSRTMSGELKTRKEKKL